MWFFLEQLSSLGFQNNCIRSKTSARWIKIQCSDVFCFLIFDIIFRKNNDLWKKFSQNRLQIEKIGSWDLFLENFFHKSLFFSKIMSKIEKQKTSRNWIFIHLASVFDRMQFFWKPSEDYCFKKTHHLRSADRNREFLDRILTRIIGFRIQILPKCHQKVQLEHYFSQRVFRVTKFQNILRLSTRRDLSISEEI